MLHNTGSFASNGDVDNVNVGVPLNMSGQVDNIAKINDHVSSMQAHLHPHYPGAHLIQQMPLNMSSYANYPNQRTDLHYPDVPTRNSGYFNHLQVPTHLNPHKNEIYDDNYARRQAALNRAAMIEASYGFNVERPPEVDFDIPEERAVGRSLGTNHDVEIEISTVRLDKSSHSNMSEEWKDSSIDKTETNDKHLKTEHEQIENGGKEINDINSPYKETDVQESREKLIMKLPTKFKKQKSNRKSAKPTKVVVNQLDEVKLGLNLEENIFLRDPHGFSEEYYNKYYKVNLFTLVESQESVEVATNIIKEGIYRDKTKLNKIYQCVDCVLLFRHPKRFLIHRNWHMFGQLNQNLQQKALGIGKQKRNRTSRQQATDDPQVCDVCHETYGSRKKLRLHKARVHPADGPKKCDLCDKSFNNSSYLRNHMFTHSEERKFMCEECPKTFKFLHSLLRHQPTHKEKIFPCPQCDKKFGSELLLNIHAKTHEKFARGTTFHCSYCGKGFYHSYNLAIHERTHRGEKPFKCDLCDGAYSTNSSLKRHLRVSHSKRKPFECSLCHRCFSTEAIRDRHAARAHSEFT